jgi:predicted nucleic acid-binding Zn ribbon protein
MADRTGKTAASRDTILRDLWLKHGCPEKMTIHARKTGETIILVDGLPLQLVTETTGERCVVCQRPLPKGRPRFCGAVCGRRFHDESERRRKIERADEAVGALVAENLQAKAGWDFREPFWLEGSLSPTCESNGKATGTMNGILEAVREESGTARGPSSRTGTETARGQTIERIDREEEWRKH